MADERLSKEKFHLKILKKPESTSVISVIIVFLVFAFLANPAMFNLEGILSWTESSALIGVLAVGVCLLMIAGEFDLSIGSMIGFSGMTIAILTVNLHLSLFLSLVIAFFIAGCFGFLNGYLVVKTRLPSFIVTLAGLFILRGLTIAISRMITGQTLIDGVKEATSSSFLSSMFGGYAFKGFFSYLSKQGFIQALPNGTPSVIGVKMIIIWWILLTIIGIFVLRNTKYGNWIYATGGDEESAKNMGVPTDKVKIMLFIVTSLCACLFAACQVLDYGSADAQRGLLKEFEAIIAVVMGGTLLTGGYGTVIGASIGALIFGTVNIGISYTSISSDWFRVFLGLMLLFAVVLSNSIRKKAMSS